jgi:cytochrome P450
MSDTRQDVHFDHHSPDFARDPWSVYAKLREECPVAHSDAYGGFWVLSKYEDIRQVALDDNTFSSESGVIIPPKQVQRRAIPIESDPPLFREYRRIMSPLLSHAAAVALEPVIQGFIDQCIDEFIEAGRCDIVAQFADPVPAMATLHILGLPVDTWRTFAEPLHLTVFHRQDNPIRKEALPLFRRMREVIDEAVSDRRRTPRDDGISMLLKGTVLGRPITDEEVLDMIELVLSGGLDTTGSAIGNALLYMDDHPEARQALIENPDKLAPAVEELLRYEAPQQGLARTATRDCVVGGRQVRKGDRLFLLWASGNRDEEVFADPDNVVLDRSSNRHMTFGLGAHRCLGSHVARREILLSLRSILDRMPDYSIARDQVVHAETIGVVYGYFSIPMTFTPGPTLVGSNGDSTAEAQDEP